jgi:uncharacterized DUF497 family protein
MNSTSTEYSFEWDEQKAGINLRKHQISFEQAAQVFKDKLAISLYDGSHSEIEERWFMLGRDNLGRLLVVSHTFKEIDTTHANIRIISARLATNRENAYYENEYH